jgi:hypothetical protein
MFGLVHLVVSAERDGRRNNVVKIDDRSYAEAQVWLWQHKLLFFAIGVLMLTLLIVSGNGV